jgi:hypothetical protein
MLLMLLATVGAAAQAGSGEWVGLGSWSALKVAVEEASSSAPLTITVPGPDGLFDCDYDSEIEIKAGANVTILGNGVVLDAADNGRLFNVAVGASLTLHMLTLKRGKATLKVPPPTDMGGAIANAGELHVFDCTFAENKANDFGGAIYNMDTGTCTMSSITFPEIEPNIPTSMYNAGNGTVQFIGCNGIPGAAMAPDSNALPVLPICVSCNTLTAMCSAEPDSVLLPGDCAESCVQVR